MVRAPGEAGDDEGSVPGGRAAERRRQHLVERYGEDPAAWPSGTDPDDFDDDLDDTEQDAEPASDDVPEAGGPGEPERG